MIKYILNEKKTNFKYIININNILNTYINIIKKIQKKEIE